MKKLHAKDSYRPQQAQQLVRNKLLHRYAVTPDNLVLQDQLKNDYAHLCDMMLDTGRWQERRKAAIENSHLSEDQTFAFDLAALDILAAYGDALVAREHVSFADTRPIGSHALQALHADDNMRRYLGNAYINHVSNQVQEKLEAIGLTPECAIRAHGMLIKSAINAYLGAGGISGYVLPLQNEKKRPQAKQAIHDIRTFWQRLQEETTDLEPASTEPLMEQNAAAKSLAYYENQVTLHRRAREDMLRKILPIYGLSKEDLLLENIPGMDGEALRDRARNAIKCAFDDPRWLNRFEECFGANATAEKEKEVMAVMRGLMMDYIDGLQVRMVLQHQRTPQEHYPPTSDDYYNHFYTRDDDRYYLTDLYLNHITNEAQAAMTVLTNGDEEAAFKLHCFMVGTTGFWARNTLHFQGMSYIHPKPAAEYGTAENIAMQQCYGHEILEELNTMYREDGIVHPRHAARIRAQQEQAGSTERGR